MRPTAATACAALLVIAVSGCAATDANPATETPSGSSGVQHEGSYEPLTSGSLEPAPDGARWVGAAAPPLVVAGEAGYTALLQPQALAPTTDIAAGVLRVDDGCLEVVLDGDPTHYGAVLVGAVGHGGDGLVIDGIVLPFGERLELPWADTAPMREAPDHYRSACSSVEDLFGIGP